MEEQKLYDLVIVGAGCVGMAAAHYALKTEGNDPKWSVCLIESQDISSSKRYWSSSFSARQNRVQYNEEYLTRYVVASNDEWGKLEAEFSKIDDKKHTFLHK
jgi:glycine/D-amino acid oxidase-like deaminating enzyme